MLKAKCRGISPTEFFPSDGVGVEVAQQICDGCPVVAECLEYALENRIEHGVWGGASERERRRILRRRRQAAAARTADSEPLQAVHHA
ncbi:MAG: WhiB family transcriptional regulator [Acidimicrobiia bacterium]|nr:WhiB family transcriptional regulator [Acidimicrobiia bacterium]